MIASCLVQMGKGRPQYYRRSWEVWPHAMLVIGMSKGGEGTRSEVVTDTPKDLLVAYCEIKHASFTNHCLTRPVIWTAPDPRTTPE